MKIYRRIRPDGLHAQLARLAGPIFMETLLVMTLGAVDTVMLSQHSDNSVAAVGLVNQLLMLVFLVFEVISLGTSILCSQYLGAKLQNKVIQTVGVSILFNALMGIVVSSFLYFGAGWILNIMHLRPELMQDGLNYMRIVGGFAFVQAISMTISASLRSADKAVYPMMITFIVNILNILGNYALIFGKFGLPELGVEGAAISTSVSRFVAMILLIVVLFKKHINRFPSELFRPFPFVELGNLLKIGIPSAGEQISYSLSQVVITYFINMLGNEALAARTYCTNMIMFVYLFSVAVAQGGAICIGHLVGKNKTGAAFVLGKMVMRLSIMISIILSVVLALSGASIFSFLTSNENIIKVGVVILWIDVILEFGRSVNIFAVNALRSAGDIYYPVLVGLVVMWGVSVVCSYIFGITLGWGLIGMWFAFLLDENIRAVLFIRRWYGMKWVEKGFVNKHHS